MLELLEERIPVTLDCQRETVWNANTMTAFERASARAAAPGEEPKGYWDVMLGIFKFFDDHQSDLEEVGTFSAGEDSSITRKRQRLYTLLMKYITTEDLCRMLWASIHEYDDNDKPTWPLTESRIGRLLKPQDTVGILFLIIRGHQANSPDRKELGEASGQTSETAQKPTSTGSKSKGPQIVDAAPSKALVNGGAASTALAADAFD